jgi:hypothetical protein
MSSLPSLSSRPTPLTLRNKVLGVIVVIVLIGLLGVFYVEVAINQPPVSTPIVVNRVLLNGTITVDAGLYYVQFIIPSAAFDAQVSGNFTVSGGNNIRVYVMNEANFNNLGVNGFNFAPDYDSGQVATGDINATLRSSGTYYLVYDNSFQASQKIVNTIVNLTYLTF